MEFLSRSVSDTENFAREFYKSLSPQVNGATLVCLSGDLGSGKTTFVQFLAKYLGIKEEKIKSPTFVIMKFYQLADMKYKQLVHVDAYRLEGGKELEKLGFKEILKNSENLILLEWPEKVSDILDEKHIQINFEHVSQNERLLKVNV